MTKYVSTTTSPVLVSVGGTLITPTNTVKSAGFDTSKDTTETTGSGDAAKTYFGTQRDGTFSFEGYADTAGSTAGSAGAQWLFETAMSGSAAVAIIVYGSGSASGAPKETADVIIQSVNVSHTYNEVAALSVTGQVTGGVTKSNV